jgi:hypothetical protein
MEQKQLPSLISCSLPAPNYKYLPGTLDLTGECQIVCELIHIYVFSLTSCCSSRERFIIIDSLYWSYAREKVFKYRQVFGGASGRRSRKTYVGTWVERLQEDASGALLAGSRTYVFYFRLRVQ